MSGEPLGSLAGILQHGAQPVGSIVAGLKQSGYLRPKGTLTVCLSRDRPVMGVAWCWSDCPGSASGRALRLYPHRLTPSSSQVGRSDKPLSHKRCLSFCEPSELSAQEMEPRTRRAGG